MGLFSRRRPEASLARDVLRRERPGERPLAVTTETYRGGLLVAGTTRVWVLDPGGSDGATVRLSRPWLDVLAGAWEPVTGTISVTWVDGGRAAQWTLGPGGDRFSAVFYERVAASVLVDAVVVLDDAEVGRVAIRRDLSDSSLVEQIVPARGVRRGDPQVAALCGEVLAELAESAGLR
ncbi:hypothetical protein [Agilicoccus flavus]|uniref:hypothetical protein n=1 Tax=Agilicoccus flavus TaxID=2775968 RepID=UPI001CF6DFAB|nr:hypothetical protein [Agilicoccus flavus]